MTSTAPLPSPVAHCVAASVVGKAGRVESLTHGLKAPIQRFPWKPSATMLTYRLTGTKVGPGSTTTNRPIIAPCSTQPQQATTAESSPTTVRHGPRRRTADLAHDPWFRVVAAV